MADYYVESHIKEFIFGGKAEFTILNTVNNMSYKYHVKANKEYTVWFISVKIAGSFEYVGFIKKDPATGHYIYSRGKKGRLDNNHEAIKGLFWVLKNAEHMNPKVKIIHHGKCAVCAKPLTDELSIERGIGPICFDRIMNQPL